MSSDQEDNLDKKATISGLLVTLITGILLFYAEHKDLQTSLQLPALISIPYEAVYNFLLALDAFFCASLFAWSAYLSSKPIASSNFFVKAHIYSFRVALASFSFMVTFILILTLLTNLIVYNMLTSIFFVLMILLSCTFLPYFISKIKDWRKTQSNYVDAGLIVILFLLLLFVGSILKIINITLNFISSK